MKKIFEPVNLGNLQIRNRIIRSATLTDKEGENRQILPHMEEVCANLSKGDVGLIITGMFGVGTNSGAAEFMPRIDHPNFTEKFRKVADAVHENGGKIVVQMSHCGANAEVIDEGENPWGVSDITSMMGSEAKEMTKEQIARVVSDFGTAAEICKNAGADGVQIHAAHAYLLSQFLSPCYNQRTDEYGGSIENRARVVFEVYDIVREKVGSGYPVLIKINYEDLMGHEGFQPEDSQWVCGELSKRGIDAIEVSSGIALSAESRPMQKAVEGAVEGHFTKGALKIAEMVACPVISVGGYRNQEQIENVLNMGKIAAISMSRPFVNPMFISQWDKNR